MSHRRAAVDPLTSGLGVSDCVLVCCRVALGVLGSEQGVGGGERDERSADLGLDFDLDRERERVCVVSWLSVIEGKRDAVGGGVGAVMVAWECECACDRMRGCVCIFACEGVVDTGGVGPMSNSPSSSCMYMDI